MPTLALVGIVVGAVILTLVIFIVIVRTSNAKRFNKKFKKQFDKVKEEENISFEPIDESPPENSPPVVEDYVEEKEDFSIPQNFAQELNDGSDDRFERAMKRFAELKKRRHEETLKNERHQGDNRKDDFDEFMNEHSYGRMFADKTLFEQIKDLSPEMKAIVFSGIFRPYDEDK